MLVLMRKLHYENRLICASDIALELVIMQNASSAKHISFGLDWLRVSAGDTM